VVIRFTTGLTFSIPGISSQISQLYVSLCNVKINKSTTQANISAQTNQEISSHRQHILTNQTSLTENVTGTKSKHGLIDCTIPPVL
jgi:hypothetical protein